MLQQVTALIIPVRKIGWRSEDYLPQLRGHEVRGPVGQDCLRRDLQGLRRRQLAQALLRGQLRHHGVRIQRQLVRKFNMNNY